MRVGGLGIVDVADAIDLPDQRASVCQRGERRDRSADHFRFHSPFEGRQRRSQHILKVVGSHQPDFLDLDDRRRPRRPLGDHPPPFHPGGRSQRAAQVPGGGVHRGEAPETEGGGPRGGTCGNAERPPVRRAGDQEIFRRLHPADPGLGREVVVVAGVPVVVVVGHVEDDGNRGPEGFREGELEARDLADDDVVGSFDGIDQRVADVAGSDGVEARGLEHRGEQRGGGGLAVRTGHGQHGHGGEAPGKFDLAPDRDPPLHRRGDHGVGGGHTRRHHEGLGPGGDALALASQL